MYNLTAMPQAARVSIPGRVGPRPLKLLGDLRVGLLEPAVGVEPSVPRGHLQGRQPTALRSTRRLRLRKLRIVESHTPARTMVCLDQH